MGLDDDADCVEHDWVLAEVDLGLRGAQMVDRCTRCGAVAVERSAANDPNRVDL